MAVQPVHVGGHWQIVNVGWGGPNIGVIALDFSMNARAFPTFTISDFPFSSGSYNLFQDTIKVAMESATRASSTPVSKEMRKHLYVWQFTPTKLGPNSDFICSGAALVFLNLGKIIFDAVRSDPGRKDITLCIVHTPAGGVDSHTSVSYWLWDNSFASSFEEALLNPLTTGDPFSPFPPTDPRSVMTLPRGFLKRRRASAVSGARDLDVVQRRDQRDDDDEQPFALVSCGIRIPAQDELFRRRWGNDRC